MSRYTRQQLLEPFTGDAQDRLASAKVLVVGAGGLGSPVSSLLVRAGVGELTLVDDDVVSISNLHRQTLYTESDIGTQKVEAARARLEQSNCEAKILIENARLSVDNVERLVQGKTLVIDAADSFFATYLLNDHCFSNRVPYLSASVLRTQGYLGVFCGTESNPAPSYRAIFSAPPTNADSCDTAGVTGPSVAMVGALQAQEALKVILHDDSQLLAKIIYLDLWNYRQQIIDFSSAKEPAVINQWRSLDSLNQDDLLVDVRTPAEIEQNPTPRCRAQVQAIALAEIEHSSSTLNKDRAITLICQSGQRALSAASTLVAKGFEQVAVTARES